MKKLNHHLVHLLVFLAIVSLSGCRTYGDYGSEPAIFAQITESNDVFESELTKARGELPAFQEAARQDDSLTPLLERYEQLLAKHEQMVQMHKELAASLDVRTGFIGLLTSSYRDLNRALGNIAANQAAMRNDYYLLADEIAGTSGSSGDNWSANVERSRYQAIPPFYQKIRNKVEQRMVSSALQQRS